MHCNRISSVSVLLACRSHDTTLLLSSQITGALVPLFWVYRYYKKQNSMPSYIHIHLRHHLLPHTPPFHVAGKFHHISMFLSPHTHTHTHTHTHIQKHTRIHTHTHTQHTHNKYTSKHIQTFECVHNNAYEPLSSYLLGYPEALVAPKLNSTPDENKFT